MSKPLMPKATAVWLVDNTSLTFEQIGDFCGLHPLEVKGIADGEVAQGIKGLDPVATGQLSRDMIERAQEDSSVKLELEKGGHDVPERPTRRGPRYTPLSKRQEKPDAIYWMIRNHPEVSDAQIGKLIGTTKPTIQSIRDRTHWNAANLKPVDPVSLGLCKQTELDEVVQKAAAKKARAEARARKAAEKAGTIKPTEETLVPESGQTDVAETVDAGLHTEAEAAPANEAEPSAESVFDTPAPEPKPEEKEEQEYDPDSVFAGLAEKFGSNQDQS